jgi:hypothetical protein
MSLPKIRERFSSDNKQTEYTYRWQGDGYSNLGSIGHKASLRDFSLIRDVVGTPKTQRVKPVNHYSAHYRGLSMQPFDADHMLKVIFTEGLPPWLPFQDGLFESDYLRVPHSERVQAAGRAFNSFSERFPSKISGAEFFQGLLELSALLPKFERTITQTIASGFLTKKFGWDNLLSDLKSFSHLIGSIRERMEFLKRTYGKPTKLYHREPEFYQIEPWTFEDIPVRGFGMRFTQESYRADFIATATLVQNLSHIDDFIGWLRAIVISLGLNNPLVQIWKTTRLSFVVDWFFDVSGHLTRLASVQPAEKWDVFDISSTVVWTCRIRVDQVNKDLNGAPDQVYHLGYLDVKQYERLVGLPVDLTVFTPSTCTPDQLVLMLAMSASK